jgi:hypothetical protein
LERQTEDERYDGITRYKNNSGFTAPDAKPLTLIAQKLIRGEALTGAEDDMLMHRLPKYWGQFAVIEFPMTPLEWDGDPDSPASASRKRKAA